MGMCLFWFSFCLILTNKAFPLRIASGEILFLKLIAGGYHKNVLGGKFFKN